MKEFVDCLTEEARKKWAELLLFQGCVPRPAPGGTDDKVKVEAGLEKPEEIDKLMRETPRRRR